MFTEVDPTLSLPGLSPVCGKPVIARFDGGRLSSDGGVLLLAEAERRLGIAERLARCIEDPRTPERVAHGLEDPKAARGSKMIRFRTLAIAGGVCGCQRLRAAVAAPQRSRGWLAVCQRAVAISARRRRLRFNWKRRPGWEGGQPCHYVHINPED